MMGLMPTGTVASTVPKPSGVDGVVRIAVGIGGQRGRRAERDADDADGAGVDSVAGVGDDELVAGWGEVCPEGRGADCDRVGGLRARRRAGWSAR